jgi:hypothetical protein
MLEDNIRDVLGWLSIEQLYHPLDDMISILICYDLK